MPFNRPKLTLILEIKISKLSLWQKLYVLLLPMSVLGLNIFFKPGNVQDIEKLSSHSFLGCVFYFLTGWLCPGCGMTRSLLSFFTGNLYLSFDFNPFGPLLGFFIVGYWLYLLVNPQWTAPKFYLLKYHYLLIVVILWGVFRNIGMST